MAKQNFENHIRFYAPHHFVFYPVCLMLIGFSANRVFMNSGELRWIWVVLLLILVLLVWFSFMVRQHYAITLQDRIIVEELRFRYFRLTGKDLDSVADQLKTSQIIALRFASDEELPSLLEQAITANTSPKAIKRTIRNWKGDYRRV